jgi:hypothetical protein
MDSGSLEGEAATAMIAPAIAEHLHLSSWSARGPKRSKGHERTTHLLRNSMSDDQHVYVHMKDLCEYGAHLQLES